jgi:hypothetical protein
LRFDEGVGVRVLKIEESELEVLCTNSAALLGMPCSALKLVCGITINSEQLTDTAKWKDILKLYEIDKKNMLCHLLPNEMHRHLNP